MSFKELDIKKEYRSLLDSVAKDFYIPLLIQAVKYQRAVGFFSSSCLVEISKGISELAKNGGKIQLVASPYLSDEDIEAIKSGYAMRDQVVKEAIRRKMTEGKTPFEKARLNLLANLISDNILDIKIAFTEDSDRMGMYHEKMGIITDAEGNRVAFAGSMNESAAAMTRKIQELVAKKASSEDSLLKVFNNNAHSYFAKKMISDALSQLAAADKIDTGIPYIHAKTIEFLIKRKKCICGADIEFGNEAYKELNELLEFIPPQSIGTSIGQFVRECELRCKSSDTLFEDISTKFGFIREFDNTYTGYQNQINIIREKLEKMKNVGELQARLSTYERALRNLSVERRELDRNQALLERDKERRETERKELSLKDENNRKIEVYKAYAQYMYTTLLSLYQEKENETRQKLEQTVNEIFKSIYNGGFSLSIDEKYNIQVIVNEFEGVNEDVETSTAQSISVIFAFIAGVIKMARQSQNPENEMLVSEPYPLVMDAPLSAFDKARIRTVCDALPNVAEQVIIFIKDTDGELAETYMGDKVGSRFEFDKKNEFETNLVTR